MILSVFLTADSSDGVVVTVSLVGKTVAVVLVPESKFDLVLVIDSVRL